MELRRDIYNRLLEWKRTSNGTSALLIEGARRVGKSTVAEALGKNEYRTYALIDFAKASPALKANFENNLNDLDTFYQRLSLEANTPLYPRESLIIFDEIQRFPKAREAVKYLVADGRFDILETGSLISIKENVKDIVIPSEEHKVRMFPLTFQEFLSASGQDLLSEHIERCWEDRIALDRDLHAKAASLLREYILVGGMPQSVVAYLESGKSFYEADKQKRLIIELYKDDIKKAARRYTSRVSAVFDNIPGFLSRHEKRVTLKQIEDGGTFAQFDDPIYWLDDSMICNLCYKCTDPNVGFALSKDDSAVKCYMGDTGLLVSLAFSENEITSTNLYKRIMDGKLSLNEGMLHENLVAQMLTAAGKKLYFYTHYSEEKHRNDIEVDFLLSNESKTNTKVCPIEVKSSKNYHAVSYDAFRERFGKRVGASLIVHPKQLVATESGLRLPTYMLPYALEGEIF